MISAGIGTSVMGYFLRNFLLVIIILVGVLYCKALLVSSDSPRLRSTVLQSEYSICTDA